MATTIQISSDLLNVLKSRKMYDQETYEEVIRDLIEDTLELSEETKKHIKQARAEFRKGKVHTLKEVEKELGL